MPPHAVDQVFPLRRKVLELFSPTTTEKTGDVKKLFDRLAGILRHRKGRVKLEEILRFGDPLVQRVGLRNCRFLYRIGHHQLSCIGVGLEI